MFLNAHANVDQRQGIKAETIHGGVESDVVRVNVSIFRHNAFDLMKNVHEARLPGKEPDAVSRGLLKARVVGSTRWLEPTRGVMP